MSSLVTGLPLLILGASGMLGQALCIEAKRRGISHIGVARTGSDMSADLTRPNDIMTLLEVVRPRVILNAAAQTNLSSCEYAVGDAYLINARLPAILADYCRRHRVKLVQISTDHYYSGDGDRLHNEETSVLLLNEYSRAKYAAEAFVGTCPESLTLRTNIVGFRGWSNQPSFIEWVISSLQSNAPMTLFRDFYTSSIDVRNFALAVYDLIDMKASGLLNVAARTVASKEEFILQLAKILGLPTTNCVSGSVHDLPGPTRAESLGLDVRRAEAILQRQLPDLNSVIETIAIDYKERINAIR